MIRGILRNSCVCGVGGATSGKSVGTSALSVLSVLLVLILIREARRRSVFVGLVITKSSFTLGLFASSGIFFSFGCKRELASM